MSPHMYYMHVLLVLISIQNYGLVYFSCMCEYIYDKQIYLQV